MKTSTELMGEAFQRARHHWKRRSTAELKLPPRALPQPLSIAIDRQQGALGNEIGRLVGAQLHWTVYEHELVEQIAKESGLRQELLESVDEKETSWLIDCLEAFAGADYVSSTAYAHELAQVLASLSAHGECVIIGHGAVAVLPRERTLRVRVIAELSDRVHRVSKHLDCSAKDAKRNIEKTDRERADFVKKHFSKDVTDQHLYDLVLSSSRFSAQQCAQMIVVALEALKESLLRPAEEKG